MIGHREYAMTEEEWLVCDSPHPMLYHLRPWRRRRRKFRFYACASFRRQEVWVRLKVPCKELLDVSERHAIGLAGSEQFKAAKRAVQKMTAFDRAAHGEWGPPLYGQALLEYLRLDHLPQWEGPESSSSSRYDYLSEEAILGRAEMRQRGMEVITEAMAVRIQSEYVASQNDHLYFLRDIFGNPFRPVVADPAWLTPTAVSIASSIYQDRAFDRLPSLADALEEAGCTHADVLLHCRTPGEHVRGCWVVDLVLGKV